MGFDFLPSDLLIPVIFIVWVIYKIKNDRKLKFGKIGKMIVVFLFVLTITYFISLFRFPIGQMITAFAYLGRFGMYLILPLMLFDVVNCNDEKLHVSILDSRFSILVVMIISMLLISILGFLQLKYFPSFLDLGMELKGWDPHIGRLLSTWFDPNFVGGYLAFVLGPVIALWLYFWRGAKLNLRPFFTNPKTVSLLVITVVGIIGSAALYLTYSRSGYLAFLAVLGILALLKSRKLLIAGVLIVVLAFSFSPRIQERTIDAWDSGKALIGLDSQKPLDPTARLRVFSWNYAWDIIGDNIWTGIGYNRYAFEFNKRGYGALSDHDAGGSDSSILTIWATSGIFGLLSYLAIGFVATVVTIKRIWGKNTKQSYINAGLLAGFGGMMMHSVFVNSLLFPLMMVYLMVGLAILDY